MKLTWFGQTAIRIYIGGRILVIDPQLAPDEVDQAELVAGAETVVRLSGDDDLRRIDPGQWRPRRAPRMIEEAEGVPPVDLYRVGAQALLVDAAGEAPLVLVGGEAPEFGRWADGVVAVLFEAGLTVAEKLVMDARPKLIALAGSEEAVERTVEAVREQLEGAGLVALEAGLAVEV